MNVTLLGITQLVNNKIIIATLLYKCLSRLTHTCLLIPYYVCTFYLYYIKEKVMSEYQRIQRYYIIIIINSRTPQRLRA